MIYVHSSPRALCPHVEWAAGRALGRAMNFIWRDQPVLRGAQRADFHWEGPPGSGAAISSGLRGWDQLRFEVTEDASAEADGARFIHTPELGMFHAPIDHSGNTLVTEDRLRSAMESSGTDVIELHSRLRSLLGQEWDDELEPFRQAADFSPVVWLHSVG